MKDFVGVGPSGAMLSIGRQYRYTLWRRWGDGDSLESMCCFIGLNPSTADETEDDPTIRRCIDFSKRWGFAGLVMLNIFAFRAIEPKVMKKCLQPVGPENDGAIRHVAGQCGKTICAWGSHGGWLNRGDSVRRILTAVELFHLGQTKDGHPKHPLYLLANTEPSSVWI